MSKEQLWLERLRKYIDDNKADEHRHKVCSWWLRIEYDDEATTSEINYYLDKSVKKGILSKETSCYYSRYWFNSIKKEG